MAKEYKKLFVPRVTDKIISSPHEIETFMNSSLYRDFINEIDLRLAEVSIMLDDFETQYTGREYDMFRGRKRNLLEMKDLFSNMKENKISDDLELEEGESNAD